jgi:hypothetical protein
MAELGVCIGTWESVLGQGGVIWRAGVLVPDMSQSVCLDICIHHVDIYTFRTYVEHM